MRGIILAIIAIVFSVALFGATYTVKAGDTLEGIAVTNGVTVEQLAQANQIDPPYVLLVGMKIKISDLASPNRIQVQPLVQPVEGEGNLLLPNSFRVNTPSDSSCSVLRQQALVWGRSPTATVGLGRFWNAASTGYYQYFNGKWQPVNFGKDLTFGAWGEIGNDFCQAGSWSQTGQYFKAGPVLDFYRPGNYFSAWSLKTYYGFRHSKAEDGVWEETQESETWAANLWLAVYQDGSPWLSRTSLCSEYVGLIEADAVGGNNDQNFAMPPFSPVKWEISVEECL